MPYKPYHTLFFNILLNTLLVYFIGSFLVLSSSYHCIEVFSPMCGEVLVCLRPYSLMLFYLIKNKSIIFSHCLRCCWSAEIQIQTGTLRKIIEKDKIREESFNVASFYQSDLKVLVVNFSNLIDKLVPKNRLKYVYFSS